MRTSIDTRSLWGLKFFRAGIVAVALVTQGCITSMGFVPAAPKMDNRDSERPSYSYGEVRRWAEDVRDGYDTRVTVNRHAIYGGAIIAAAAASAVVGLAAFGSNTDAITGVGLGGGFFGSVAAIYSNEEKAKIYRYGSFQLERVIMTSEKRWRQANINDMKPDVGLQEAIDGLGAATTRETEAKARAEDQRTSATGLQKDADSTADPTAKAAKQKVADEAKKQLAVLDGQWKDAQRMTAIMGQRKKRAEEIKSAAADRASKKPDAQKAWDVLTDHDADEAICLYQDVMGVMHRVEEHISLLDPKNLADRFRGISAGLTSDQAAALSPKSDPTDLSDLKNEPTSACGPAAGI